METIGERITNLMREHGYTKTALGQATGTAQTTITNYLENRTIPKGDILMKFSELFGVTTDYILFGNKHQNDIEDDLIECFRSLNSENQLKVVKEAFGLKAIQDIQEKTD